MKSVFLKYLPDDDTTDEKVLALRKRAAIEAALACCRMAADLRPDVYAAVANFAKNPTDSLKQAGAFVAKCERDNSGRSPDTAKVSYYAHKTVCAKPGEVVGYAVQCAQAVFRIGCATSKTKAEQVKAKIEGALEGVLAAALAK